MLLGRAAARAPGVGVLMMEVDEPGNPRCSWDLNLYDAELTVGDVADVIETAAADFGVGCESMSEAFAPRRASALGHVAGGAGRDGEEFLTIYYGVEARGGRR
jgi:tryptophan halogenase